MPRIVLDLRDRRAVWAMPPWVPDALREALPDDWEVHVVDAPTDGSGDGRSGPSPAVLAAVKDAKVYVGWGVPGALLEAAPGLEWAHTASAGVGSSLSVEMLDRDVVLTNSAGTHAPPMAETVVAMILHFLRGLDFAMEGKRRGSWWQAPFFDVDTPVRELSESTVGIIGYGGIGKEVARRVASLGAKVIALKRTAAKPGDAALAPVRGTGTVQEAIEIVTGEGALTHLLARSDAVVVCAPRTPETDGLMDAAALAHVKAGAVLVNVARGALLVEDALLEALSSGRLRGAALDVFATEPLPEGHPLWTLPNVLPTPHVSGVTRSFWRRETDLIRRNLERYLAGVPADEWENVVDKRAGY